MKSWLPRIAVYGTVDVHAKARHGVHHRLDLAVGPGAEITGDDTQVVLRLPHALGQGVADLLLHVQVDVAELQYSEAVEGLGQTGDDYLVASDADGGRVSLAAAIQPNYLQRQAHQGVHRVPVLDVEEVTSPAEDLGYVLALDSLALV